MKGSMEWEGHWVAELGRELVGPRESQVGHCSAAENAIAHPWGHSEPGKSQHPTQNADEIHFGMS